MLIRRDAPLSSNHHHYADDAKSPRFTSALPPRLGHRRRTMLDPRALSHAQLAEIVADVQAILWQESRMRPDDPREYGDYWNPGKEDDGEGLEQIADILADADLKPPDYMPVAKPVVGVEATAPRVIDPNELLWAARILSGLVSSACGTMDAVCREQRFQLGCPVFRIWDITSATAWFSAFAFSSLASAPGARRRRTPPAMRQACGRRPRAGRRSPGSG
jgi:hypothetical protein